MRTKRKNWRKFCESVKGMPKTARLCRVLFRNSDAVLDFVSLPDETMVTGERCLVHLLKTSFPGFRREHGKLFVYETAGLHRVRRAD